MLKTLYWRQKIPWREAAGAFLLSRFLILSTTWISLAVFPLAGAKSALNCWQQTKACLQTWNYWDLLAYIDIAHYGYRLAQNSVFFPLWPLCIRLLGILLGGTDEQYFFAALLLANLFFYLALILFFLLARRLFSVDVARNALFYLALSPYALFFFTGYTESFFLLLSLITFVVLQCQPLAFWWIAGLAAGLATLTRPTGIVLLIPYAVFLIQRFWRPEKGENASWREKLLAFVPMLPIPLALCAYMVYLDRVWHNPWLFLFAERAGWGRHQAFPWDGLVGTMVALLTGYQVLHNLLDLVFTLLPVWILVLYWKKVPISYSLYSVGMVLFSLSNPSVSTEPLTSAPRYMLTIFPCFLLLAVVGKRSLFERLCMGLVVLLIIFTAFFVHHYWLA